MHPREAAREEHRQDDNAYPEVLNYRGNNTEHDVCGTADTRTALFRSFRGSSVEIAVLCSKQDQERTEEAVYEKRNGRVPGRAEAGTQ
ncbi:hypothetical protein Holit_02729 [Hollandina sp. SP2]